LPTKKPEATSQKERTLSILELTLLQDLKKTKKEAELSNMTNVDKKVISQTLDKLYEEEYIGQDLLVTEKGFDLLNQTSVRVKEEPHKQLSTLELLLLQNIHPDSSDKELSKLLDVDLATVSAKLDKLYDEDYISDDIMLTEKGFGVVYEHHEKDIPPPPQPQPHESVLRESATPIATRTIVIQREIVKVPCKYCGTLNEIATAKTCSNCGAAIR
jgi:predicted transcriptional regulator